MHRGLEDPGYPQYDRIPGLPRLPRVHFSVVDAKGAFTGTHAINIGAVSYELPRPFRRRLVIAPACGLELR